MRPDSLVEDTPITQGAYRPKNAGESYRGQITLKEAFARSSNVAAVRLYTQLGEKAVLAAAKDLGVSSPLTADPSLALGTSGMTLLELTSAYAAFAADRWPVKPHSLPLEEPGFLRSLVSPVRSFDARIRADMLDLLNAAVTQGTGRAAALRIKTYGKTGTTQDYRDALFIGFAENLVVGVWVGKDDNTPLKGINGGGLPARIWRDFMGLAIKGAAPVPPAPKPKPKPKIDIPTLPDDLDFPIGIDDADVRVDGPNPGVTLKGDVGGLKINLDLGRDGIDFNTEPQR
jgi:penicillin-binding protein 1A